MTILSGYFSPPSVTKLKTHSFEGNSDTVFDPVSLINILPGYLSTSAGTKTPFLFNLPKMEVMSRDFSWNFSRIRRLGDPVPGFEKILLKERKGGPRRLVREGTGGDRNKGPQGRSRIRKVLTHPLGWTSIYL
jgi:hypothetical protein